MMKKDNGFSLIEVAIALIIIGLLMGNLLTPISARMNQKNIKRTEETLEQIKQALLGFAVINGRLPCAAPDKDIDSELNPIPAEDKGEEHSEWCNKEGYLPWKDLGVGRFDAWGNLFRYRAEDEYTPQSPNLRQIFGITGTGSGLRIRSRQIDPSTTPLNDYFYLTTTAGDSRVAAIIFSPGKNRVADDDNNDLYKTYVSDVYVENDFDDILTWVSRNALAHRLIKAQQWEP